jgi:hypothetical protein
MKGHYYYHVPAKRYYVSVPFNGKQEKFWMYNGEPIGHKKTASKLLALLQVAIDRHERGRDG